jgi:hypothetical protein
MARRMPQRLSQQQCQRIRRCASSPASQHMTESGALADPPISPGSPPIVSTASRVRRDCGHSRAPGAWLERPSGCRHPILSGLSDIDRRFTTERTIKNTLDIRDCGAGSASRSAPHFPLESQLGSSLRRWTPVKRCPATSHNLFRFRQGPASWFSTGCYLAVPQSY